MQLWFEIRDNEGEREKLKKLVISSSCQDNAIINKKRRYKRRDDTKEDKVERREAQNSNGNQEKLQ